MKYLKKYEDKATEQLKDFYDERNNFVKLKDKAVCINTKNINANLNLTYGKTYDIVKKIQFQHEFYITIIDDLNEKSTHKAIYFLSPDDFKLKQYNL